MTEAAPAAKVAGRRGRSIAAGYPATMPALTSMRFVAAAWVLLLHYSRWLPHDDREVPIVAQGGMAVDFFFMLSGFVLSHAHRRAVAAGTLDVRDFLVRRLARIYPMHAVTMAFYAAMVAASALLAVPLPNPERYGAWQLLVNVTLLQALQLHDAGAWNYPSWSIGAEWVAYLAFPLIASPLLIGPTIAGRRPTPGAVAVAGAALVVATHAASPVLFGVGMFDLHSNFGWARILPEFMLGMALYAWGRRAPLAVLADPLAVPALLLVVVALAWFDLRLAMLVPLAALILAGAEMARSGGAGLLSSPRFVHAGNISYALYMVHLPVATVVLRGARGRGGTTPSWAFPLACVIALLLAAACHRLVERPGGRLVRRLAQRRVAS